MKTSTLAVACALALSLGAGNPVASQRAPSVIETVFVGPGVEQIAVNPLTDRAFVANPPSRSVVILDLTRNEVVRTLPLFPLFPEDVALDCMNNRVYVAARLRFHYPDPGLVAVVDGESESLLGLAPIGAGRVEPAFHPFTNRVYAIASHMPGMTVLEGETGNVLERVSGPLCRSIGVDPVADLIYVSDQDDRIRAVDAAYHPSAEPATVRDGRKLAVDPAGHHVYLTQYSEDRLTILDGGTGALATLAIGEEPLGLAVNPMTGRAYVANHGSGTVSVIEGEAVVGTVQVGRLPTSVAVNPLTGLVYVVNASDGTISVIDDLDPASPPHRILADRIANLMVEAGGAGAHLQEALGFVETGAYDKAADSLLAFSEEIEGQTVSPELGEKLATAARKIIVMMIGN